MDRATRREQRRRVDVRRSRIAGAITCWPSAVCTPVHRRRQARGEGEGHGGTRGGVPSHDREGTPHLSAPLSRCRCVEARRRRAAVRRAPAAPAGRVAGMAPLLARVEIVRVDTPRSAVTPATSRRSFSGAVHHAHGFGLHTWQLSAHTLCNSEAPHTHVMCR